VRCVLHDLSLGGAYMIRSTEFGPPAKMEAGDIVRVTMHDTHHGGSYDMEAEVIRVEALDGPGLAVRWRLNDADVKPFSSHIEWEAAQKHVPKAALGVPILNYRSSKLGSAERISKAVVPIAIVGMCIGIASVGIVWLRVVFGA